MVVAADRDKPQTGRKPRFRQDLKRRALVLQQGFGNS